jgi:putative DNA primase/helicase
VGKTHVALGIAYAVTSGGEFLRWRAPKPRGVLYLDGEMPANMMQERLRAIENFNSKRATAPFQILTPDLQNCAMPDLSTHQGQAVIESWLDNIDLIIVDNIATLCRTGSENEAEAWKPVQDWALRMRSSKRAVLFVHHAGKKGAQRGSSAKEDTLNTVIHLTRPDDYSPTQGAVFEVHFEKSRGIFGAKVQPFKAQLTCQNDQQVWVTTDIDPTTYLQVINLLKQGKSQNEIAVELDLDKSTISRHANNARKQGLLASFDELHSCAS